MRSAAQPIADEVCARLHILADSMNTSSVEQVALAMIAGAGKALLEFSDAPPLELRVRILAAIARQSLDPTASSAFRPLN